MSEDANENLRTASLYINNQLLSRGLLHDGQSIDFADPAKGDGGVDATMGKIMSIVNDLILRRDRDAQHRESLSTTLRTLRADNLKSTNDFSKLREKQAETQRKLEIAESSEAALRTQLKSADAAARGLKEEMARAKTLVAQTRASCATDVRRRDRQIEGLKKQLSEAGRARGSTRNPAVTTIHVVAGVGAGAGSGAGRENTSSPTRAEAPIDDKDGSYDLRSETNEFLTQLAKNLSEDNEALLALVRKTLANLGEMTGWDGAASRSDGHVTALQTNCAELESELGAIVDNLRGILTNPSFVPIEEVEIREEEINRLKEGWVKMESRWQEAVHLMEGWRRRMLADGKGVNMEELNMGLRLSPVRPRQARGTNGSKPAQSDLSCVEEERSEKMGEEAPLSPCPAAPAAGVREESLALEPASRDQLRDEVQEAGVDPDESESSIFEDDPEMEEELEYSEPNIEVLEQSAAYLSSSSPLPAPPQLSPLKDSSSAGNRDPKSRHRSKPGDFTTIVEENTWDLAQEYDAPGEQQQKQQPSHRTNLPRSPIKAARTSSPAPEETQQAESAHCDTSLDDVLLVAESADPPSPSPLPRDRTSTSREASRAKNLRQPKFSEPQVEEAIPVHSRPASRVRSGSPARSAREEGPQSVAVRGETPTHGRNRSPQRAGSRLPLPRPANPAPQQSPLTMATIAAKLAASEREADAARVRAKLRAARGGSGQRLSSVPDAAASSSGSRATTEGNDRGSKQQQHQPHLDMVKVSGVDERNMDPVKRSGPEPGSAGSGEAGPPTSAESPAQQQQQDQQEDQQPAPRRKREKRVSKAASRRRSTLSPWEMESLISGNATVASPVK